MATLSTPPSRRIHLGRLRTGLASIAGGGFLTLRTPAGDTSVLDFFTTVPGLGGVESDIEATITVVYPAATQDFRVGAPSAAVPGCLSGWLAVHADHGRLPLPEVMAPSVELAAAGAEIDSSQSYIMGLIGDILRFSQSPRAVRTRGRTTCRRGSAVRSRPGGVPGLGSRRRDRRAGFAWFRRAVAAATRVPTAAASPADDLADYEPVWRHPLQSQHNGWRVDTNPAPPSVGGSSPLPCGRSMDQVRRP